MDGPDDATRPKGHQSFQSDNTQLVHSTGVNVSVMVLQGCLPQKSRPLESGHMRRAVWIAIGPKNEFKFLCELGWFLQRQSHMANT